MQNQALGMGLFSLGSIVGSAMEEIMNNFGGKGEKGDGGW